MAKWKVDYGFLYKTLDEQRRRRGASWRQVAADIGISPGTFTRLKDGKGVADEAFATLMDWLGAGDAIMPFLVPSTVGVQLDAAVEKDVHEPEA